MTEMELLELLGDVQGSYIQQADAFREGRLQIVKKKRPVVTALKILSTAAMLAVILGAGYLGMRDLASKAAKETTGETMALQAASTDAENAAADWQRMALRDGVTFSIKGFEKELTMSEFCGLLGGSAGTEDGTTLPKIERYAALDMDNDWQEELVVTFTGSDTRLVLGNWDGTILGKCFLSAQMDSLKDNGCFFYRDGMGGSGWARLRRDAGYWVTEELEESYFDMPDAAWTEWVPLGTAEEENTDWQRMVLRDGSSFYSPDYQADLTMSEFCEQLTLSMGVGDVSKLARYTALDMDGDGQEELVAEFEGTGSLPRLVLGRFDGEIYGFLYYIRQMNSIKQDGTFYYSGGIGNRGWGKLRRSGNTWVMDALEGDYSDLPDAVWTEWVPLGTVTESDNETQTDVSKVTPELLGRVASRNLTVWQGSDKYPVLADLFIGDGYSLYIPREGWVHEVIDYHGATADRWVWADETLEEFGRNSMIDTTNRETLRKAYDQQYPTRLTILFRPGMDDQAIRDWVMEANPDWDMTQNARGALFADGATVEFLRTETGAFVCIMETPAFGTEGLGILGAMYESFNGWPSGIPGYLTGVSDRDAETTFMLNRYIEAEQRWEEYPVDFRLYRTYGYSTYIPKEGFVFRNADGEVRYGGYAASIWMCEENVNVWFAVVSLNTTNFSDAIQWGLSTAGSDYDLYEDNSGGVSGESADGTEFLSMSFQEKDFNGIYAVIRNYPIAETDNLSAYVKVMADQFQAE